MASLHPQPGTSGAAPIPPAPRPLHAYDVFLSYSHADQEFVVDHLLVRLETEGVKVVVDNRDFLVGAFSVASMEEAVAASRHTLAVLTPEWVASRWTAFESLLAQTEDPLDRKLLPLLLRSCEVPRRIRALVYADFTEPSRREAEFAKLLRSIAATAPAPGPVASEPVRRGLVALGDLLQEPEVRDAVVAFRIHFQRIRDRSGVVGGYKDVHDLLHALQLHCYDRLVQEAKRFPDDEVAVDNLGEHETTLRGTLEDLRRVEQRASLPAGELSWIERDLEPVLATLHAALESLNPASLRRAISLLNRVLTVRPSEINTRLHDAARDLPLSELGRAMHTLHEQMRTLALDAERVQLFAAGAETLDRLGRTLAALVADHDRWQEVEQELRLAEETWDGTVDGLNDSWARVQEPLQPLLAGTVGELWSAPFRQQGPRLEAAIAARDPERARRCFRGFRREAATRFHQVDVMLKDQCQELQAVAEPLAELLRRLGP